MANITSTDSYSVGLGGVFEKTFLGVENTFIISVFSKVLKSGVASHTGGEPNLTTGIIFPNGRTR